MTIYNTIEEIGDEAFRGATIGVITFTDHDTLPSAEELVIGDYAFASATFAQ